MSVNPQKTITDLLESDFMVTLDDGVTNATILFMFAGSTENLGDLLKDSYDIVITVGLPSVRSYRDNQNVPVHHPGMHPVNIYTVDKYSAGVMIATAVKIHYKCRIELRTTIEDNAQQSGGVTLEIENENEDIRPVTVGGWKMMEVPYIVKWMDNN